MSPKMATTPEVIISLRASTSLVIRVTSRPTGVREKNAIGSVWMWAKMCIRRSYMTRCPTYPIRYVCSHRAANPIPRAAR